MSRDFGYALAVCSEAQRDKEEVKWLGSRLISETEDKKVVWRMADSGKVVRAKEVDERRTCLERKLMDEGRGKRERARTARQT